MAEQNLRVSPVMQMQLVMAMVLKFIVSPILFFISGFACGMRGDQLKALIIQGMIPQVCVGGCVCGRVRSTASQSCKRTHPILVGVWA